MRSRLFDASVSLPPHHHQAGTASLPIRAAASCGKSALNGAEETTVYRHELNDNLIDYLSLANQDLMVYNEGELDENGSVVLHMMYDEWGAPQTDTSWGVNKSGVSNLNNYTGYSYDEVLELYFAQARFYDPITHGFIQEDPIKDGHNWYSYVANNPMNATDPTGELVLGIIGVMFIGALVEGAASGIASAIVQEVTTGEIDSALVVSSIVEGAISGAISASPLGEFGVILGHGITSTTVSFFTDNYLDQRDGREVNYLRNGVSAIVSGFDSAGISLVSSWATGGRPNIREITDLSFADGSTFNWYAASQPSYVHGRTAGGALANNTYAISAARNGVIRGLAKESLGTVAEITVTSIFDALKCDNSRRTVNEKYEPVNKIEPKRPVVPTPETSNQKVATTKDVAKASPSTNTSNNQLSVKGANENKKATTPQKSVSKETKSTSTVTEKNTSTATAKKANSKMSVRKRK